jgi:hypothetical protein
MSILYVGEPPVTHQFYRIYQLSTGEWVVCLAGRQGLGTRYFRPYSKRFKTKKAATEWRGETLADSPNSYWVAPTGKYLLDQYGSLVPCHKTEKATVSRETSGEYPQ